MIDKLIQLTASDAVQKLRSGDISPLDMIAAAEKRISEVEPAINALPTLCLERARDHAKRLMSAKDKEQNHPPCWLAGLPVAIKDYRNRVSARPTYIAALEANSL